MKKSKQHGIESVKAELGSLKSFLENRFAELKREVTRLVEARSTKAARPAAPAKATKAVKHGHRGRPAPTAQGTLLAALDKHNRKKDLVQAGKQRDQLLRSLIPLYLARGSKGLTVNSGAISAFWKAYRVSYAGPNAAKALREHVGYAKQTKGGWEITPNGIKYVDAALNKRAAA